MKILIAYAGKTGTSETCAALLQKELGGRDITLADLNRENPDPSGYDVVVVGGAVRFGKMNKRAKRYTKQYEEKLSEKKTVYFTVCCFADRFEEYVKGWLTDKMRDRSLCVVNFGGTLKADRQKNILTRLFVRSMRNGIEGNGDSDDDMYARILPEIITTEISKTAEIIKKAV